MTFAKHNWPQKSRHATLKAWQQEKVGAESKNVKRAHTAIKGAQRNIEGGRWCGG